jgi:pyruvate dehydrogenase (quinone)
MVLNNRDLNQVTWEMRAMEGDPRFNASQDLPDVRYSEYAELLGLRGIFVKSPEGVGPAWEAALTSDRPCVLEAYVDPDVPPLPPHITLEQAKDYVSAIVKGDTSAGGVLKRSLANMFPALGGRIDRER